jgi:hypothetical protein
MYRIYRNNLGQFRTNKRIAELKKEEERSIFLVTVALMVYIPAVSIFG